MFIIEANLKREMKILLRALKAKMGNIPPHFELFASIHPKRFEMFLEEVNYFTNHPHINRDFFALLRYTIATKNDFTYCIHFNKALLLEQGYIEAQLDAMLADAQAVPIADEKHQILFAEVLQAMDNPEGFTKETIERLNTLGWSDADIYDGIDHGAFLYKFAKIIKTYSVS